MKEQILEDHCCTTGMLPTIRTQIISEVGSVGLIF